MDVDVPTFAPRRRMSRYSPVRYDKSSNLASTSEAGPSRLPNFSQILDLDLDVKDMPFSDDQFSLNELNTPKLSTTPTATRSDNPAAVLRALLSRLPAHSQSPSQSHALSVQCGTERESDFDTLSVSNVAPSIAQESLKHIFSKAVRDPGNTPQKVKRRRNSIDASAVEASPRVEKERATNKGKRRSMSDDELENTSQSVNRRDIGLKSTSQPVTLEFLRERFIDSHNLRTSVELQNSLKTPSNNDSSNDAATIFQDLNSSQATPPAATSTPRQSLRLSASSRFQLHSNLLDQDSEMQKAIEGLDSYDESVTHDQTSTNGVLTSSKTLQTSPALRHQPSKSTLWPKPKLSSNQKSTRDQSHSMDDLRTPSQHRERFHVHPSRSPSPALQLHSRHNVTSDSSHTKPSKDTSAIPHSERHRRSEIDSTSSRLSPLPRTEIYRHHSPPVTAGLLRNHDDDYVDVVHERERNWNSPRPIWHKRSRDMESDGLRDTDFSSQGETSKLKVVASSPGVSENDHSRSPTPLDKDDLHEQNGIGSSPPHHSAQIDINTFPSTPTRSKASRSLINGFKTPSPPKGLLPDLPTPSSSDESDHDSPRSKQSHRNNQSGLRWMTPKPPGGWLNTPKPSRESSPSDIVAQSDGDTPASFQSFSQTPKPPGGWVSNPAPVLAQPIPVESSVDIPEQNRGLLTPVASLSKGSKLEPKTPAVPGAWLATPAVKKSILKVRFEPDGDDLQRMEQLSSKSPPSSHRQKSPKPKIRVLDAFGREQELDASRQEHINNSSPIPLRVVDALGHEIDHVEGTEAAATPSHLTFSRGELLSRIRNGLDDLVVDIDEFDKDNEPSAIDHDKLQQLTTISSQARELRGRLYSQADSSRSVVLSALDTKKSWFPTNPKVYILIILQLSLIWLTYRISINRAQELWLNRYYDPFNPELHLYIFKFGASPLVLRSEGARTTAWSSLVGQIWDMWIYFIEGMQFCFWQVWDKGTILQYDNAWTPT